VTLAVQVLSFASSIALAQTLGASDETDAYYLALSVPVIVYAVLLAAIRLGAIPALTRVDREASQDLGQASSAIVTMTLLSALALTAVTTALAAWLLPAAITGSAHLESRTRLFIVELAPFAVSGALVGVLGAILAVRDRFVAAAAVMAFEPAIKTVLVLTLGDDLGGQSLVLGNLVGNGLAVVLLWCLVRRTGIPLHFASPLSSPIVRTVVSMSAPLVIGQTVLQFNPLIDRTMASGLSDGSVTAFELGARLFNVPMSLLGATLIAPLAANWSARMASEGWHIVVRSFSRSAMVVVLATPPIVAVGIGLRDVLVDLCYAGGAYSESDAERTADVLGVLMLCLPVQLLLIPLSTLFIVQRDTVFPMKIAIANIVLNVGLNLAFRSWLGVAGIALATVLTYTSLTAVYLVVARRRWGDMGLRDARRPALFSALSAGLVLMIASLAASAIDPPASRLLSLVVVAAMAAIAVVLHLATLAAGRARIRDAVPLPPRLAKFFPDAVKPT
jgi:putative peptidoglycan lipid II flippase